MSHYHLNIAVEKEEVEIIKRRFEAYLDVCGGGFMIHIIPDSRVSPEFEDVEAVLKTLFIRLIALIDVGAFEGLH